VVPVVDAEELVAVEEDGPAAGGVAAVSAGVVVEDAHGVHEDGVGGVACADVVDVEAADGIGCHLCASADEEVGVAVGVFVDLDGGAVEGGLVDGVDEVGVAFVGDVEDVDAAGVDLASAVADVDNVLVDGGFPEFSAGSDEPSGDEVELSCFVVGDVEGVEVVEAGDVEVVVVVAHGHVHAVFAGGQVDVFDVLEGVFVDGVVHADACVWWVGDGVAVVAVFGGFDVVGAVGVVVGFGGDFDEVVGVSDVVEDDVAAEVAGDEGGAVDDVEGR